MIGDSGSWHWADLFLRPRPAILNPVNPAPPVARRLRRLRLRLLTTGHHVCRSTGQDHCRRPQWLLRSSLNFATDCEFDVFLRRIGTFPDPAVSAYTAVDARIGWRPRPEWEFSVTAQNLFDPHHIEFGAPATASQFDRGVFFKVVWRP